MKGGRERKQSFADQVEAEPGQQQPQDALKEPDGNGGASRQRDAGQGRQAPGTKEAFVMFGDALAAEEFAAALATADRLALGMIEATLVVQELHQRIRGGTFGSSSAWAAGWIWAGCWAVGRVLASRDRKSTRLNS